MTARFLPTGELDTTYNFCGELIQIQTQQDTITTPETELTRPTRTVTSVNRVPDALPQGVWIYQFDGLNSRVVNSTLDVFQRLIITGDLQIDFDNSYILTSRLLFDQSIITNEWEILNFQPLMNNPTVISIEKPPFSIPRSIKKITITGTTPVADLPIDLLLDGQSIANTISDNQGRWNITIPNLLDIPEGTHTLQAINRDEKIITLDSAPPIEFTIEDLPHDNIIYQKVQQINSPILFDPNVETTTPIENNKTPLEPYKATENNPSNKVDNEKTFNKAFATIISPLHKSIVKTQSPIISGTSTPNSKITVLANKEPIGITHSDSSGLWNLNLKDTTFLQFNKKYSIQAQAEDYISSPTTIFIDTHKKQSTPQSTSSTLKGKSTPNSIVQIYMDNNLLGKAPTDKNGNWSITINKNNQYKDKQYNNIVNVITADTSGNESSIIIKPIIE